jgi:hypothetical protein
VFAGVGGDTFAGRADGSKGRRAERHSELADREQWVELEVVLSVPGLLVGEVEEAAAGASQATPGQAPTLVQAWP